LLQPALQGALSQTGGSRMAAIEWRKPKRRQTPPPMSHWYQLENYTKLAGEWRLVIGVVVVAGQVFATWHR